MSKVYMPSQKVGLEMEQELGQQLAAHNGLMTPIIKAYFGDVYVVELCAQQCGSVYERQSAVYQRHSERLLLHATLKIYTQNVETSLMAKLKVTDIPFGQLLVDYGYETEITELTPFTYSLDSEKTVRSHGRHHTICGSLPGASIGSKPLATVEERFVNERELQLASTYHQVISHA